jgi:hypothetical protein
MTERLPTRYGVPIQNRASIERWFDEGRKKGAHRMIVMTDDFDCALYPLYLHHGQPMPALQDMQKAGEEFDLTKSYDEQFRAFFGAAKTRNRELDV